MAARATSLRAELNLTQPDVSLMLAVTCRRSRCSQLLELLDINFQFSSDASNSICISPIYISSFILSVFVIKLLCFDKISSLGVLKLPHRMEMQIEGSGSGSRRETIIGCDGSGEKMKFSDPLDFGVVGGDFVSLPSPERLPCSSFT